MIIHTSEEVDNKNFVPNFEKSFGIKDETFILQILRTNTYSDPIGSICREVVSNCRDSHREAGKAEVPVEVELLEDELSNFKKQLVFRDFGVGLSPERINEVYTVYGESTKRNSNQFTGGFGLGAKTPFAYTDSFQVKTIYNGLEYTYQLVIDKSEKGKIIEISKIQSDKQNQTEVIIPLQDKDVITFTEKLIRTIQFWNPRPKFIGFENVNHSMVEKFFYRLNDSEVLYENKYGRFVKDENYNLHSINVLVDKIIYPLNLDSLKRDFKLDRLQNRLVIEFDNGELDLSISREQLYYTKRTITKVQRKLDNFINVAFQEVKSKINSLKTPREKFYYYHEQDSKFSTLKSNLSKVKNLIYSFENEVALKNINHLIHYSNKYSETKKSFQNKNSSTYEVTMYYPNSFYGAKWWKFPVIIKSYRDRTNNAKIETLKSKYPEGFIIASKISLYHYLKSKDHYYSRNKSQYIKEGKKDIHKFAELFDIESYKSVEKTKSPRVKKEKSEVAIDKSKKVFSGFKYKEGFLTRGKIHKNDIDKNESYIIVSFDDSSEVSDCGLTYGKIWNQNFPYFYTLIKHLDNSKNYSVIFLCRDEIQNFKGMASDSITVEDFLKGKISKKLKDDLIISHLVQKLFSQKRLEYNLLLKGEYSSWFNTENVTLCFYEKLKSENQVQSVKSLDRLIKILDKNNLHEDLKFNKNHVSNLLYYITGRKIFQKDLKQFKVIDVSKFALLNYIKDYNMSSLIKNDLQELIDYIKKGLGEI